MGVPLRLALAAALAAMLAGGLEPASAAQLPDVPGDANLGLIVGVDLAAGPQPTFPVNGRVVEFSAAGVPLVVTDRPAGCITLAPQAQVLANTTDVPVAVYADAGCGTLALTVPAGYGANVATAGSFLAAPPLDLGTAVAGLAVGAGVTPAGSHAAPVTVFADPAAPLAHYDDPTGCLQLPARATLLLDDGDRPVTVFADPACRTASLTVAAGYGGQVTGSASWSYGSPTPPAATAVSRSKVRPAAGCRRAAHARTARCRVTKPRVRAHHR